MPTSVSLWASNGYSRFQREAKHPCGVLRFFFVAGLRSGVGRLKWRRKLGTASDIMNSLEHLACCRQSGRLRARQAAYKLRLRIFRAGAFVRRARSLSARAARDSARCSAGWAASDSGRVGPAPVFAFFEVAPRGFHYRPAAGTSTTLRRRTYHR